MTDLIKQIILDFQYSKLYTGTRRQIHYSALPGKAFICIGVRRSGKSTFFNQIIKSLCEEGVPLENILYVNFFDDRLTELRKGDLTPVLDAYFSLYPEKQGDETVYCFFDEIQEVQGWELFIDRIMRTEKCQVFITGSSAKMLSKEIATQMRGRSLPWELYPFSFIEYLDHRGIDYHTLTTKNTRLCGRAFDEYFQTGGFPEVLDLEPALRIRTHQEYYKAIINRDIIDRYNSSNPQAIIQLAYRLVTSVANPYSLNRLFNYLKGMGFKTSKEFVSDGLQWFEDCYFMFSIKKYDRSVAKQNVNMKKIYCVDHGIVMSIDPGISEKNGFMLENLVFMRIKTVTDSIYYYRTESGKEVDFLVLNEKGTQSLIQVSYDISDSATLDREVRALIEAMAELNLSSATIVTYSQSDSIKRDGRTIDIVPGWQFCLKGAF
ncbi:MAG TPA: ATP-binding protein [Spirochaetota bacterium]|nr:ATP-binding protein [Spirochaetota bacterium]HQP50008.1 ATP-binding protein [Spirochaetota bacterium]